MKIGESATLCLFEHSLLGMMSQSFELSKGYRLISGGARVEQRTTRPWGLWVKINYQRNVAECNDTERCCSACADVILSVGNSAQCSYKRKCIKYPKNTHAATI